MLILKWVSFHFYCSEKKGNIQTMFEHFLNYPLPQTISRAYFLTTLIMLFKHCSNIFWKCRNTINRWYFKMNKNVYTFHNYTCIAISSYGHFCLLLVYYIILYYFANHLTTLMVLIGYRMTRFLKYLYTWDSVWGSIYLGHGLRVCLLDRRCSSEILVRSSSARCDTFSFHLHTETLGIRYSIRYSIRHRNRPADRQRAKWISCPCNDHIIFITFKINMAKYSA